MKFPIGPGAALMSLGLMFAACSSESSVEQQIITVILDMETHIEAGERRPFIEHVAAEFTGQDGALTRDQLNALVLYQLHRHKRVHAQLLPILVTTSGPREAEANFRALLTGGPGWLPENGQLYEFTTRWQRQNGEWMLISARWKPVFENAPDFAPGMLFVSPLGQFAQNRSYTSFSAI